MDTTLVHAKIKEILPEQYAMYLDPNKGISSSQANAIAEKSKEIVKITLAEIAQTSAAKETLHHDTKDVLIANPGVVDFKKNASITGELYSVSAHAREAIKAKDKALLFVNNVSLEALIPKPELVELKVPEMDEVHKEIFTEESAIAELGLVAFAEYIALNSQCGEIGKLIHNNGALVKIKNDLANFNTSRFHSLKNGDGVKDYPVTREAIYKAEDVNKQFFELMDLHREAEKKVNWYKAKIQNIISDKNAEAERVYCVESQKVHDKYKVEYDAYIDARKAQMAAISSWTSQATEMRYQVKTILSSYKIIIPNALSDTYDYIEKF